MDLRALVVACRKVHALIQIGALQRIFSTQVETLNFIAVNDLLDALGTKNINQRGVSMVSLRRRRKFVARSSLSLMAQHEFSAIDYPQVKNAALETLDSAFPDFQILVKYNNGSYDAATDLDAIGINTALRRGRAIFIDDAMAARFPSAWRGIDADMLAAAGKIGKFILLLCDRTRGVAVPFGEPR